MSMCNATCALSDKGFKGSDSSGPSVDSQLCGTTDPRYQQMDVGPRINIALSPNFSGLVLCKQGRHLSVAKS